MKNDNFMGQGLRFSKYVIVGHWPSTLYDPHIQTCAPLMDHKNRIISIDGGCVLKIDGQLNALMVSEEGALDFTWRAYDGLPTVRALDSQQPSETSLNIRWGRSALELLEPGEEFSLCRHVESGQVLPILTEYLRHGEQGLWCEDSTDYRLPVSAGERLTLVVPTSRGALCKKNGVTGWYLGRYEDLRPCL
jgi:protein phosphatase